MPLSGVELGAIVSGAMDTSWAATVCVDISRYVMGAPLLYVHAVWQSAHVETRKFIVVIGKKTGATQPGKNNMRSRTLEPAYTTAKRHERKANGSCSTSNRIVSDLAHCYHPTRILPSLHHRRNEPLLPSLISSSLAVVFGIFHSSIKDGRISTVYLRSNK